MRSGQAKWTSIALVIDFYGHLDMILDTTFARLEKVTWMINDGGRPGEVHRTGKQKGGRLIIKSDRGASAA